MVISFFPQTAMERYVINKYNCFCFDKNKNLITTDHGAWCLLSDEELDLLRKLKVHEDPTLFHVLKDKGVIITGENFDKAVEMYRERFHFLFRGPTLHIVVPTFRCNQHCVYCHSSSKRPDSTGYDMDEDTAKSVVDFIFKSPSDFLTIEFQGGDCLFNFDIVKFIIEYAEKTALEKNKKVRFSIITNLTMMTEEKLNFLKEHKIMGMSTSLDGPKEVHDANRKYLDGKGSYDDVVYWIKRIRNEFRNDFNLNALTTITRYSLSYPKEIVDEFIKLGFNNIWLRFLNNLGFAHSNWEKIGYTPDEYVTFWNECLSYIMNVNSTGRQLRENFATIFSRKILNIPDPMFLDIQSPCGAAIGQLLYNHKGDIFTCDEAKVLGDLFKLGNVKEHSLLDIIRNPTTLSMINLSTKLPLLCDACTWSPYCGVCPIEVYMTQGTIVPKLSTDFRCIIFKKMIKIIFEKILFSKNEREILIKWTNNK
jgi:His-Xaa-Ser system radical SAM maturase HxsB